MKIQHPVRPKWMVVDDNESILHMTAQMLSLFTRAEICCFQSAETAARAFESDPSMFELVITDFDMPEMNGAELCRRLRMFAPELKIILTTGSSEISSAKAHGFGFDGFLTKPFSMAALSKALEKVKRTNVLLDVHGI